jgi:hypothetical protein
MQVPLVLAPAATAHTSQAALHAVPQQTPSTQWLLLHTRQPACSQSAPAAASQPAPCALRGLQVLSLAQ